MITNDFSLRGLVMLDIRHSGAAALASKRHIDAIVASGSETACQRVVSVSSVTGLAAFIVQFQSDCALASSYLAEEGERTGATLQAFSRSASDVDSQLITAL